MALSQLNVKDLAASIGISPVGVAGLQPWPGLRARLEKRQTEGRISPFEEQNLSRRLRPQLLLPDCRSIIVLGMPYPATRATPDPAEGPRGEISRCAQGLDYHLLLNKKAEDLAELISRDSSAPVNYRILSDRSPLVERDLACRAGLGWIGQNCALVSPNYGSYMALGTILISLALEPDKAIPSECLLCGRCRQACPTGALIEPHILDPQRCLSYRTQASGVVETAVRPLFGSRLYGCDLCQEVCPCNYTAVRQEANPGNEYDAFFPARPLLLPLLEMTQKQFAASFGCTAAGWRGKTTIQRNVVIALGNSGDAKSVPALARILKSDPRPLLRLHAAWALGRIGNPRARYYLEASLRHETDPLVREESRQALWGG